MTDNTLTKTIGHEPATEKDTREAAMLRPVVAFLDAVNRRDLDEALTHCTPDALHRERISNFRPEGVKVLFGMVLEAFPDLKFDILESTVKGNTVISRVGATGTHTGSLFGAAPTGKIVAWESVDVATVTEPGAEIPAQTKIFERWWPMFNDAEFVKEFGFPQPVMC